MNSDQVKKPYQAPRLQVFGDIRDLTKLNNNNELTDVPQGSSVQVGYSPSAN